MKKTLTLALALVAVLPVCGSSTGSDPNRGSDSFDTNTLPSYASFSDGGASWTVAGGELVPYLGPGAVGVRHFGFNAGWVTRFDRFAWHGTDTER